MSENAFTTLWIAVWRISATDELLTLCHNAYDDKAMLFTAEPVVLSEVHGHIEFVGMAELKVTPAQVYDGAIPA